MSKLINFWKTPFGGIAAGILLLVISYCLIRLVSVGEAASPVDGWYALMSLVTGVAGFAICGAAISSLFDEF